MQQYFLCTQNLKISNVYTNHFKIDKTLKLKIKIAPKVKTMLLR
jgi:hypothetical protein